MRLVALMMAVLLAMFASGAAQVETARLQVIHNAADPAAGVVDIYVNGDLFLDEFAFRTATPFVDVPAGVELNIGVAPGTSSSPDDIIAAFPVTLMSGKTYVAIANGVLDPSMFSENPDGKSIGFTIFAQDGIAESAWDDDRVKVIAFHGATDAPTVDVRSRGRWFNWTVFDDLSYGEFSSYRQLLPKQYILDITPGNDHSVVVASYDVNLTGLGGGAAVVFASGFLSPDDNMGGAPFGLFGALPDGNVVEFPPYMATARLQVIHNAADPAADMVDIYVNGDLFLDDFAFRAATPFVDVPAGVTLNIGVAPGNSTSPDDIIATFPVVLEGNKTYVAIANGVLDPSMFADNPDGRSIGFTIFARDNIRESSIFGSMVKVIAFHGATDAPGVDILIQGSWYNWHLVNNLYYGDFSSYRFLPARSYVLDITPAGDNSTVVASYDVDLSGLGGGAAVVFASGFLSPASNMDGASFGLFAALPNGTVVEFPAYSETARLQVIHNAADPAAEVVDIYVNGDLFLDDFAFRTATPFLDVPAEVTLNIGVAPGNSSSADDVIATIPVMLEKNETYVAVANGVLDPSAFAENPDGRSIGFSLFAKDGMRESARWRRLVDIVVFHGATDAPTVDVLIQGRFRHRLVNDLSYGDFTRYRKVLPRLLTLNVTPGDDNSTVVASFEADLSGLAGGAAVVFASGFLNPAANQNGAAFGLFAALPDGNVVELPPVGMAVAETSERVANEAVLPFDFELKQNYPNPFNPTTTMAFALPTASDVTLKVYNVLGQEVRTLVKGPLEAGYHEVTFDGTGLSSGMYFYRINADSFTETRKMMLVK